MSNLDGLSQHTSPHDRKLTIVAGRIISPARLSPANVAARTAARSPPNSPVTADTLVTGRWADVTHRWGLDKPPKRTGSSRPALNLDGSSGRPTRGRRRERRRRRRPRPGSEPSHTGEKRRARIGVEPVGAPGRQRLWLLVAFAYAWLNGPPDLPVGACS